MAEKTTLLNQIRQSFIKLKQNLNENEVTISLQKSFRLLDSELDYQSRKELFNLIITCFKYNINQPEAIYSELYQKSRSNSNFIIVTASILNLLNQEKKIGTISNFQSFINESFDQILKQINKSNNDLLKIFDKIIPNQFKINFIIDIILLSELDQDKITDIYQFILSHIQIIPKSKIAEFIQKVYDNDLASTIPESMFTNEYLHDIFSIDIWSIVIPQLSEGTFKQILPKIENGFLKADVWTRSFSKAILNKIIEYKMEFDLFDKILNNIKPCDLKESVWRYLYEHKKTIPLNLASKISNFPNPISALFTMPQIGMIPKTIYDSTLLLLSDLNDYARLLKSDNFIKSDIYSTPSFWSHLVSISSTSKLKKYDDFVNLFKGSVSKDKLFDVISEMIFNNYPTTQNSNQFLYELFENNEDFHSERIMNLLFQKTLEQEVLPQPKFWGLFDFINIDNQFLKLKKSDPIVLYALTFSDTDSIFIKFKNIKIKTQNNSENVNQIIEFIKCNDINKIRDLNEEALSLAISSLVYLKDYKKKPDVIGLNEDLVLPFFAIGFNYLQKIRFYDCTYCGSSTELLQLLLNACQNLQKKQSSLCTTSINAILSNYSDFLNPNFLPREISIQILDTLYSHLTNGLYKADKFILLQTFYILANFYEHNEEITNLLNKHSIKIIKYIIHNIKQINNINNLMQIPLNLDVFKSDEIKNLFISKIENNSSSLNVIHTIEFIEKYCQNVPSLLITYPTNLIRIFEAMIDKNDWDNVCLIGNFMKSNNLSVVLSDFEDNQIPFQIKEVLFDPLTFELKELISHVLASENPEYQLSIFECIFKKLMKDPSVSLNYFIYSIEKVGHFYSIEAPKLLKYFQKEYDEYGDVFLKALSIAYSYHMHSDKFVRNPVIKRPFLSKLSATLASTLLNKASEDGSSFQVFYCLQEIASSFPFMFSKSASQVFSITFSNFNNSLVEYIALKEGSIEQIKKPFYSFVFLIKCLFSIGILNEFVPWCINNIKDFNDSQIYIFVFILEFLLEIKTVYEAIYALTIKFNLFNVLADLLNRKIENEKVSIKFKTILLDIFWYYIYTLKRKTVSKLVYLDELSHLDNQFINLFDSFYSIHNHYLVSISNYKDSNNFAIIIISNMLNNSVLKKEYHLTSVNCNGETPNEENVDNFILDFAKYQSKFDEDDGSLQVELPTFDNLCITSCIRYLAAQPRYIYLFIIKDKSFPYLPKHKKVLAKAISELAQFKDRVGNDVLYYSPTIYEYLSKPLCKNHKLFKMFIREAMIGDSNLHFVISVILSKTKDEKKILICMLKQLNDFLSNQSNDSISSQRLFSIVNYISDSDEFNEYFIKICGYNFIEFCLMPENRDDQNIINKCVEILMESTSRSLPSNTNYLICFLLIQKNKNSMQDALELCGKVGEKNLTNVMDTIQNVFDYVYKELKNTSLIQLFLTKVPSLSRYRKKNVVNLLNVLIKNFLNGHHSDDMIESICTVFDSLAPDKNFDLLASFSQRKKRPSSALKYKDDDESSTQGIDDFIIGQPPSNIIEEDQQFWKLYQTYYITINGIFVNDESMMEKMKFIYNVPGLLDFKRRMNYFKEKMKDIINAETLIRLYIHRRNIFSESTDYFHKLDPYELKRKIEVVFLGEDGLDYGGLTNEWFTLIIQEIFNEKNKLFVKTENNKYQPNPLSYQLENHLELFKFSGIIVARSLIQNQCIGAHFTRSFIKQILNIPINFKDLEDFDERLFNSLNFYLENDIDSYGLNFEIHVQGVDSIETILLKENGDEIDVTNKNKKEYVNLYAYYHIKGAIVEQINAFREGFYSIIPVEEMIYFSPSEFDLLVCGVQVIDVNDMKENTVYEDPYNADHPTIKLLFDTLSKWDNENLAKLLMFVTGSPQVPINGFVEYKNKGKPIKIIPGGDKNRFCVAHTCFNILALPYYETQDELNKKLLMSIQQTEFGLL